MVVSVGTDHHRFDRLVSWMDQWAADHPWAEVVIQRGASPHTLSCESHALVGHRELCQLFASAAVVVSHGGPSTVMDARAAGRFPIVVPRDPAQGEHVDDHQLRFSRHLACHGLAAVVTDQQALVAAIQAVLDSPARYTVSAELGALPGVVGFARVVDELMSSRAPAGSVAQIRNRRR